MGIPENIDALLVKYDINQDHLARIADVTPGAVTGWRKGSTPRKDAVRNICDYFNLSEDDILSENYGLAAKEYGDFPGISNARPAVGMAMGLAPRLGKVHAGVLAQPDVCDEATMVSIPQFLVDEDPDCFVVSSEGDCMDKVLYRDGVGGRLRLHRAPAAHDGQHHDPLAGEPQPRPRGHHHKAGQRAQPRDPGRDHLVSGPEGDGVGGPSNGAQFELHFSAKF